MTFDYYQLILKLLSIKIKLMRKVLITTILLFLFFLSPKIAKAVSCQVKTPADQIFVNISTIEVECTGLQANKRYIAKVFRSDEINSWLHASGHCTQANDSGKATFVIPPRHVAVEYTVVIAEPSGILWTGHCNPTYSHNEHWRGSFSVNPPTTVTIQTCPSGLGEGMVTALGCIPTKPDKFVIWFLQKAIGLGGGIAFLLIIWGAFTIITSAGNPEKLNNGKEIIVSAVSGLLMIIFSVVLLKIIGVDILGIPGFGK